MFRKLIFSFLFGTLLFVNPIYADSHSSKKPQFMWTRTFEVKPGVSPVAAMRALMGILKYVNKNIPSPDVTMMAPLQGNPAKFRVFYIADSVDERMMVRGKLFTSKGFQPHLQTLGKHFHKFKDAWWMIPPQGITWNYSR